MSEKRPSKPWQVPKSTPSSIAGEAAVLAIPSTQPKRFSGFVVAIGASAGGLEALERFFKHCPSDTGAAFVVIQHLSPDHKSMMHALLGRYTPMKVRMVLDGMVIEANHVYLPPPGTVMRVEGGQFQLNPQSPRERSLPIDIFLTSLANEQASRAVAVILSGAGSDGSRGATMVNAAGGLLLAQEPSDARFGSMPQSVIATGIVDAVLPAEQLVPRVVAHLLNMGTKTMVPLDAAIHPLLAEDVQEGILQLLLHTGGVDFHDYKQATLLRRIERRMQVRHQRSLGEYLVLLEHDRAELATLRRELLVPVTSFFRDPEAFNTLRMAVVEPLVEKASAADPIRIWVAGCSTGEEAYSIAMLFLEAFERQKRWPSLKVFATDVNQQNVDFAAMGQYPDSALAELTPERLERFFQRTGNTYTVQSDLRQCIVFARHNLLVDPPFTRMSLISCRNTLIYFTVEAQNRALKRLQYAIKPKGYLFLGSSESIAGSSAGFTATHPKHKLFQRTGNLVLPTFMTEGSLRSSALPAVKEQRFPNQQPSIPQDKPVDLAIQSLLEEFAPPSMLLNDQQQVVHMFGDVSPFFRGGPGIASLELHRILPDNLVTVASALIFKAFRQSEPMFSDLLRVPSYGHGDLVVRLIARRIRTRAEGRFMLLSFLQERDVPTDLPETVNVNAETMARVDLLERELGATRANLQVTIEELERSNEQLQAINEELMASNEELQRSNEELQAVNQQLN